MHIRPSSITLACALMAWTAPCAANPPPAPVALVEEITAQAGKVSALDYLASGEIVELGRDGKLTLDYLASCVRERISGGKVTVGTTQSQVENGQVERTTTQCNGGQLSLTALQAAQSGATAIRDVKPVAGQELQVNHVSPFITLKNKGNLVIKRIDQPGERYRIDNAGTESPGADLAAKGIVLTPGASYALSMSGAGRVVTFKVASNADNGAAPLLTRLIPF
ncbi:MAG: hypothetical protein HQM03_01860 [Magnetococcales bacterium]|nr:hypothetical protein [Magnetococcales bacterium]